MLANPILFSSVFGFPGFKPEKPKPFLQPQITGKFKLNFDYIVPATLVSLLSFNGFHKQFLTSSSPSTTEFFSSGNRVFDSFYSGADSDGVSDSSATPTTTTVPPFTPTADPLITSTAMPPFIPTEVPPFISMAVPLFTSMVTPVVATPLQLFPTPTAIPTAASSKLTNSNYLLWCQQVEPVLKGHCLHHFLVNPTIPPRFRILQTIVDSLGSIGVPISSDEQLDVEI
ncbi:hypothetical protein HKD37_07G020107 [Glycine soja]